MMLSPRHTWHAALLLGPTLAVLGADLVGTAPAGAQASDGFMPTGLGPEVAVESRLVVTPEQQAVHNWMLSRKPISLTANPFVYEVVKVEEPLPDAHGRHEHPQRSAVEGLVITGMMSTPTGGLVSIGKRVHRLGEVVQDGVTLTAIDVDGGTVELTDAEGQKHVLHWNPW